MFRVKQAGQLTKNEYLWQILYNFTPNNKSLFENEFILFTILQAYPVIARLLDNYLASVIVERESSESPCRRCLLVRLGILTEGLSRQGDVDVHVCERGTQLPVVQFSRSYVSQE